MSLWIVFFSVSVLLVLSILGHDFSRLGPSFLTNILAVGGAYVFWSFLVPTSLSPYIMNTLRFLQSSESFLTTSSFAVDLVRGYGMLVATVAAWFWLGRRLADVLGRPVPDLIETLGLEVPEKPELTVAEIRSDAVVLSWARPSPNHPVQSYSVEVNGISIGSRDGNETAISITGLRPGTFYNIRVLAVSVHSFKAASNVARVETYAAGGQPELDERLVPDNYLISRQRSRQSTETARLSSEAKVPSVETASLTDASLGHSGTQHGTRRNTIGRKHSPSTASVEPPVPIKESMAEDKEGANIAELTTRLDLVRKEIEEIAEAIAAEEEDTQRQLESIMKEKEIHGKELKKRSETSRRLKVEAGKSDNAAQEVYKTLSTKKRAVEKGKQDRNKLEEKMRNMISQIEKMERDYAHFDTQRKTIQDSHEANRTALTARVEDIREGICALEVDLREKREKSKQIEAENQELLSPKESEHRQYVLELKQQNQAKLSSLKTDFNFLTRQGDNMKRFLTDYQHNPQQVMATYHQQAGGSTSMDSEYPQSQCKRRSRASTSISSLPYATLSQMSVGDIPPFPQTSMSSFTESRHNAPPPGFMPLVQRNNSFQDHGGDEDGHGPLSPGHVHLPQGILGDVDDDTPFNLKLKDEEQHTMNVTNLPQSPTSSSRSSGQVSNPRGSANNLTFQHGDIDKRTKSLMRSSPHVPPARASTTSAFGIFGNWSSKSRMAKSGDDGGPPLGSLKTGQSQSFPRQADDEVVGKRKLGFASSWNVFSRNSAGPSLIDSASGLMRPFNNSTTVFRGTEADHSSPRPASMASSDMPRPSTESGPGWGPGPSSFADLTTQKSNFWGHSRTQSRRTSIHAAPTTNLASEDDIILLKEEMEKPEASPSQVGVIGSRPKKKRLNPDAPSFMASLISRSRGDKDEAGESDGDAKIKAKIKDKARDKKDKKGKGNEKSDKDLTSDLAEFRYSLDHSSPTELRRFSTDGRTSVSMSESHESLSLDPHPSNTASEVNMSVSPASAIKDQDKFMKLFRKGSASKFRLSKDSSSGGVGSLFKKGPSSVATTGSERGERSSISISEADDGPVTDEFSAMAKSLESTASSSPSMTSSKGPSRWGSMFRKKPKEKPSFELDRDDASTPGPETS